MLKSIIPSLMLLLFSCNSTQNSMEGSAEKPSKCPPEVECSAEILSDKAMVLKEDTIGQLYIQLEDKEGSKVIKHSYIKKGRPGLADDGYSEIVYFEIDDETEFIYITGKELMQYKLIVYKGCFCPDAGYEMIADGSLKLNKTKNEYSVSISYHSDKELKLKSLSFAVEN